MPEQLGTDYFNNDLDVNLKIIGLRKKLTVEKQMYEAAKLIKARMDKKSNVQQVENSLNESKDRITFLEEQVKSLETQMKETELKRRSFGSFENIDALAKLSISSSTLSEADGKSSSNEIDLNWFLSNQKLTWPKIEYKIGQLAYRLKVNENILEAENKLIEAYKGQISDSELVEGREITKQRVQLLTLALKKYTTLTVSGTQSNISSSSAALNSAAEDSVNHNEFFTGKLLIKVTKISGLTGANSVPPFVLNFDLDQLSSFRSGKTYKKPAISAVLTGSKDADNPSAFICYQEVQVKLVKSSELELTISASSSNNNLRGMFFIKLATLFGANPHTESSVSQTFEVEPAGSIGLQFNYIPNSLKHDQIDKELLTRIERRPAIKRTQHTVKGHELISTNFFQLLKCSYCQDMIMNTSGYQCKLCKLICHKKCYTKLFEKCLYSDNADKLLTKRPDDEPHNHHADQFTSKYNIPHRQKLVSVAIPTWCAHCGHILPLGRKINYKCEECSVFWHDRCDPYICKTHCGLNSAILESYLQTIEEVHKIQMTKSITSMKSAKEVCGKPSAAQLPPASPIARLKDLRIEDFDLIKCIGKGNFGKVMLARYTLDDNVDSSYYAIKILKKHSVVENEEFESLKTEKRVFKLATDESSPFLVHLEAMFQDEFRLYFVMEYVNGGDLMYHIQNRLFRLSDTKFYAAQVLIALEFLHERGVLYRDLKLDNILLTNKGYIKLADYGLSKCDMTAEGKTRTFCGTPEFMAPELLLDLPYGLAVDYWAFGVLLYQMLESRSPFYGSNEKETFQSILRGKLVFSPEIDKNGKSLISKLLVSKPGDRLGVKNNEGWAAVKAHPFFQGIDWEAMQSMRVPAPFTPKIKNYQDCSNFDEIFTSEDVLLTPTPSFVFAKGGTNVVQAAEFFENF